ncbi:MAG: LptF/LptG family permease [Candidatus Eremiobacteraeota bacterium]|nr:LptF/LptG family permease [Candidatus Eremiobacteraeota bacterium]
MASVSGARSAPLLSRSPIRLPILDAYVLREFLGPFVFAFGAFFLFWAFDIFFLAARYLIENHAPPFLVLRFVIFRIPQSIPMAFPFAALFATLLGMGRLVADNEVTAIRTAGTSLWRLCITPIVFGLVAFGLAYLANEYVAPKSVELSTRTFYQIIYHTAALPIEPQFFRKDPDTNDVFFVSQVLADGKTMMGVQVFKPGREGYWNETFQAKTARVNGATLVMNDVIETRYNPDGYMTSQNHVDHASIGLPLAESAAQFTSSVNSDAYTMNSKALKTQVSALKAQGVGGEALGNLEVNLASKTAFPFASFIGVIIALPLAIRFGKKGRTAGIAFAILAFFIYYLLYQAFSVLGSTDRLNPYFASWLPNIVFGIAGFAMLWFEER